MEDARECPYCTDPIPEGRRSEYCSKQCRRSMKIGYRPVSARGKLHGFCAGCKARFDRRTPKQLFCTNKCRTLHIKAMRPDKQCAICSSPFSASSTSNTCSPECRDKWREQRLTERKIASFGPPRTCCQCSKVFTYDGVAFKKFCSRDCAEERSKETQKRHGHNRRARIAGVAIEHFSPTYILKRDNYVCQACGVKTKPKEKPSHPLYPNVDHIIPISVGGEHSKKNCRCVCSSCNSKKCNKTLNDQLLLFG